MAQRHMFPGNNTSIGFYSYYQHILPQQEANRIFCLKGGPGVGKSTFMKKIASGISGAGFDIEYMHCSSDPDSLDGIVIPELKAAIIDGTAPHVTDPVNPGAVDEIINLGEYWDAPMIKKNKSEIMQCNAEIGRLFKRAYKYIAAAKKITDDLAEIYDNAANKAGAYLEPRNIIDTYLKEKPSNKPGKARKLFASGITPSGIISLANTLTDCTYDVFVVNNGFGSIASQLLDSISYEAFIRGINTEIYYSPMAPEARIEHVIIPDKKLAVMSNDIILNTVSKGTAIDLDKYENAALIDAQKETVNFDVQGYKTLLDAAVSSLKKAKKQHDILEGYYIPYMNFDKTDKKAAEILNTILSYAV